MPGCVRNLPHFLLCRRPGSAKTCVRTHSPCFCRTFMASLISSMLCESPSTSSSTVADLDRRATLMGRRVATAVATAAISFGRPGRDHVGRPWAAGRHGTWGDGANAAGYMAAGDASVPRRPFCQARLRRWGRGLGSRATYMAPHTPATWSYMCQ